MKNNHRIKLIAASVALTTSFTAAGGLGGLNVQSNLGEPFSGTVTVTGEEAKILLNGGQASLSDGNLRTSVRKSGDNAVINIRSNAPVNDPVLVFQVGVGSQSRQYTAIIDPPDYAAGDAASVAEQPAEQREPAAAVSDVDVKQSAAAQAKLKAKKAKQEQAKQEKREQQKNALAAQSQKERESQSESGKPNSQAAGGRHVVRRGETLTSIASRVRPEGLSLGDTVKALVLANPEAFKNRNANQITAGRALRIPSGDELKRLLKQDKQNRQDAASAGEKKEQAAKTDIAASSAPVQSEAETPVASAPAATPEPVPASEPAGGVAAASEPASAEAVAPASEAVPAPSGEEMQQPAEETAKGPGWWRWLLFGGAGVIVLWLLLRLLVSGRKGSAEEQVVVKDDADVDEGESFEEDEAEIRTHQPIARPSNSAPLVRAAAAETAQAKSEEGGLDVEDDFADDIFFTEAEVEAAEKDENDLSLDLGAIDREQTGILSGALTQDEETEKRKDADWDAIESTESVYEPEPENQYDHVAVEFTAAEEEAVDATVETDTADADIVHIVDTDTDAVFSVDEPLSTSVLDADESAPDSEAVASQPVESESELSPLEFEMPVVEEKALEIEEDSSSSVAFADTEGLVEDAAVTAQTDSEWLDVKQDEESIALQDAGEELGGEINLVDDSAETIEWESVEVADDEADRSEAGFISESVGMTAPLEAKYELAQMYVEIGDPEAARETLRELLEESSGNILERAKAMLAELDK